jgi:DNA integrity scanning protein DisA with diadenylate cyclase activity
VPDVVCPLCGAERDVLPAALTLAREIAREGPEGKHVGTLFTIGRPDRVLASSRPLILDSSIRLPAMLRNRLTLPTGRSAALSKSSRKSTGAFIVAEDGTFVSGGRYLDVPTSDIDIPLGLATRHLAAVAVSRHFDIVAVAVSQAGIVWVFCRGEIATLT